MACKTSGEKTLALLGSLKTASQTATVPGNVQVVESTLKDIERIAKVCTVIGVYKLREDGMYGMMNQKYRQRYYVLSLLSLKLDKADKYIADFIRTFPRNFLT